MAVQTCVLRTSEIDCQVTSDTQRDIEKRIRSRQYFLFLRKKGRKKERTGW